MNFRLASALAVAGLAMIAGVGRIHASESNAWPVHQQHVDAESGITHTTSFGPFGFSTLRPDGLQISGFRPLWDEVRDTETDQQLTGSFIYPLAHWETDPTTGSRKWTIFNLINFDQSEPTGTTGFDIWPFYFSRQTDDPTTSYRALMPIYGEVAQRFNQDRLSWFLFPLYGRFEKGPVTTTTTPWPFIKTTKGEGYRGFEFWPLGGFREQSGVSTETFALWPLIYRQEKNLGSDETSLQAGVLPFYALDRKPGYQSETYLWPFFGYVDRTAPYQYHARHYLWPLWVQGRGDERYINRWAPFYSHSHIKDHEKTWLLWPLWRQASWSDAELRHEQRQLLYFLFHQTTQRDLVNPDLSPARKTHLWPLFSSWDNGAGQKQFQAFSPIEVFLPHQERTRRLWSPLFSVYRFNQSKPGETRRSLFWNAITFSRSEETDTKEFHLGPLLEYHHHSDEQRIGFLTGIFGLRRASSQRMWLPFFGRPATPSFSAAP